MVKAKFASFDGLHIRPGQKLIDGKAVWEAWDGDILLSFAVGPMSLMMAGAFLDLFASGEKSNPGIDWIPIVKSDKEKMVTYRHEKMVTYRHEKGKVRFRQSAKEPLPKWATDVKVEE